MKRKKEKRRNHKSLLATTATVWLENHQEPFQSEQDCNQEPNINKGPERIRCNEKPNENETQSTASSANRMAWTASRTCFRTCTFTFFCPSSPSFLSSAEDKKDE